MAQKSFACAICPHQRKGYWPFLLAASVYARLARSIETSTVLTVAVKSNKAQLY